MVNQTDPEGRAQRGINIPEMSVSELSSSLQRTLEDAFGRVRVRGEISGLKIPSSGHLYADLKDENANLNIICWRSTLARLKIRPEDGMDVICTGKITTYPKSSRYQMIVDSIELAGEGALLKMLEDRKIRLAAEGLFASERKRPIPALPRIIGVVTSPTGAVIRDILHRLNDRFPSHVIVWPVAVQGEDAPAQIAAAIYGFSAMTKNRPDVVIVARGGGSLEDLMAFNEEIVVRAAANCSIPLISAVGHETDTTLIDYAADLRAPTPTAAAEMAVPVRRDLIFTVHDYAGRLDGALAKTLDLMTHRLRAVSARLGDPASLIAARAQTLDYIAHKLTTAFERGTARRRARVAELSGMLRHPRQIIAEKNRLVQLWGQRLHGLGPRITVPGTQRLDRASSLLEALSFTRVLERGFAVILDDNGHPVATAKDATPDKDVTLKFHDGTRKARVSS